MFDDQKTPKIKLEAEIELTNAERFLGFVFVSPQGRLSDLFNDDREFIPIELGDGRTVVLRKSAILRVSPMEHSEPVTSKADPYELLDVASDIDHRALRRRYLSIIKECNPDRLQSHGLPTPIIEFANRYSARVNDAYQRICRERGWSETGKDD
jgi:DnaJ-domain-containing protein 1